MSTKRKPRKYINPVQLVIEAAQEAERIRHEEYSIQTMQKLASHNQEKLVPALCVLMQWALDLQREVNQIEAKLIVQLLEAKQTHAPARSAGEGGKRERKSA